MTVVAVGLGKVARCIFSHGFQEWSDGRNFGAVSGPGNTQTTVQKTPENLRNCCVG